MNKKVISLTIGAICFILVLAIVIQVKTIKNTNSIVNYTLSNNNDLRDDLLRWKEKYDSVNTEVTKAEKELEETRQLAIQNSPDSIKKERELNINNTALGLTDVSGQGVIVTLKDNQGVTNENIGITDDIRSYLVHDANLREIVRKLKISGAEAISINDERIVNDTSIICSGNVIRVNDKKVSSPFEIKAIGSPELLYGNFCIVNGENAAGGMGITTKIFNEMLNLKVDVITMGNHTWGKKDIFSFIDHPQIIRPANYSAGVVGKGMGIYNCKGKKIAVINLIGRTDMNVLSENPFLVAKDLVDKVKNNVDIIMVDFHAEATAEK